MLISQKWHSLPIEIVNKIINYTGVVTFFKGKYYNRIPKSDPRYAMLKETIKLPKEFMNDMLILDLKKNIGESYNTPRYKLIRTFVKNNAGELVREELKFQKCGRNSFYIRNYVYSRENKWCMISSSD